MAGGGRWEGRAVPFCGAEAGKAVCMCEWTVFYGGEGGGGGPAARAWEEAPPVTAATLCLPPLERALSPHSPCVLCGERTPLAAPTLPFSRFLGVAGCCTTLQVGGLARVGGVRFSGGCGAQLSGPAAMAGREAVEARRWGAWAPPRFSWTTARAVPRAGLHLSRSVSSLATTTGTRGNGRGQPGRGGGGHVRIPARARLWRGTVARRPRRGKDAARRQDTVLPPAPPRGHARPSRRTEPTCGCE